MKAEPPGAVFRSRLYPGVHSIFALSVQPSEMERELQVETLDIRSLSKTRLNQVLVWSQSQTPLENRRGKLQFHYLCAILTCLST